MKTDGQGPNGLACDKALDELEAFLDGELTELAAAQLERHLDACGSCREELEWARKVRGGLRQLPVQPCPPAVIQQVIEGSENPRGLAAARSWWQGRKAAFAERWRALGSPLSWPVGAPAAAALALALVAGALWLVGAWGPTGPQSEEWQADLPLLPSGDTPLTAAELEKAEQEARLALVYFSRINRRASVTLRDEVIRKRIAETPRNTLRDLGLPILMSAIPGAAAFGSLDQEETL